jgi:hypothetical protein
VTPAARLLIVDEIDHVLPELDLAGATIHANSKDLCSKPMQPPRCGLGSLGHRRAQGLVSLDRDRVERMDHETACVVEPASAVGRLVTQPMNHGATRRRLGTLGG